MNFGPSKAKTNGSNWPICFVFSVKVIQALFGCLQSVGQKMKTQAHRRRYGQTLGIDANTLTHQHRGWSMMNDVWAREVALH